MKEDRIIIRTLQKNSYERLTKEKKLNQHSIEKRLHIPGKFHLIFFVFLQNSATRI